MVKVTFAQCMCTQGITFDLHRVDTFCIWEKQPLQVLLLDLAYSACRSDRVVFLFLLLPEEEGPSAMSVPPSLSRMRCWSSQRSEPNPEISFTSRGLLCLKKQLK